MQQGESQCFQSKGLSKSTETVWQDTKDVRFLSTLSNPGIITRCPHVELGTGELKSLCLLLQLLLGNISGCTTSLTVTLEVIAIIVNMKSSSSRSNDQSEYRNKSSTKVSGRFETTHHSVSLYIFWTDQLL